MADTKISAFTATTLFEGDDDVPASETTGVTNKRWLIKAIGGMTRRTTAIADTLVASDRGKVLEATSGSFSVGTTAAATLKDGWWAILFNNGTGVVTLDPNASETINGSTTLALSNGDAIHVWTDGSNFFGLGLVNPQQLTLKEIVAPGAPAANAIRAYAFDDGVGSQIRTKDEHGLFDIISQRNAFRSRKPFYIGGVGSDTSAADDMIHFGVDCAAHEGTYTKVTGDADGQRRNMPTSATIDTDAGIVGPFTMTRRIVNPDVTIKFKVITTVTRRVWIGWMEADHMASDSTAATHKFALRLSTTAANVNFCIVNSDGATETITQVAVADAAIHTIRLIADEANARWGHSFDGAAVTWVTTNIPASTADVGLQVQIRTTVAAAANMDLWWVEGSMEK